MKKKTYNDEIDISEIILNLWNNKIKIIIITTSFLILGFLNFNFSNKNFITKTNIKPISTFENEKYKTYNSSLAGESIVKINRKNLLDLFINKIQTQEIIKNGIIKFELVNKDDFKTEIDYQENIEQTAIFIADQMKPPSNDEKNKNKNKPYWTLNFKISDKESWKNFVEYLENKVNKEIRQSLINQFNTEIEILKIGSKFKLEDIEQNIVNELDDYKITITNRLAFLKEQAEIARTLNIEKNTLEAENFQTDNAIVTNIKSENSYYLKGYEMIEKEISLISSRENEKAFISNLIELEKSKRAILQNKKIERLKILFLETPVADKNNFKAAKIDSLTTVYNQETSLIKILSISLIIGLIISLIYLFVGNIVASRK